MSGPKIAPQQLRHPVMLLALGFGTGLSPRAPGTVGSVLGALLYLPFYTMPSLATWLLVMIGGGLGVWLCGAATRRLGVHDHSGIVWDEFVGIWLVLACLPATVPAFLLAFVWFRVFDVLKPWPISWLDRRIHGGVGIMLDDILAAGFAIVASQGVLWLVSLNTA